MMDRTMNMLMMVQAEEAMAMEVTRMQILLIGRTPRNRRQVRRRQLLVIKVIAMTRQLTVAGLLKLQINNRRKMDQSQNLHQRYLPTT